MNIIRKLLSGVNEINQLHKVKYSAVGIGPSETKTVD